ncbi:MAG: hypothetical protein RIC95_05810 [Vicingaceae bacterium]
MTKNLLLSLFLILGFSWACQEKIESSTADAPAEVKPLNPNGDSELALLMRAMYQEAESVRDQIKNGKKVSLNLDHGKILTAHATEPEKAASAEFKGFAKHYLNQVEKLQNSNAQNVDANFESLVSSCMTCHKALCPGPVVRIKKLQKPIKKVNS